MARHLTVSSVTSFPFVADPAIGHGKLLDDLIDHWTTRIATVLPDRPDLVVLPEHGDRPLAHWYPLQHFPIEQIAEFTVHKGDYLRDALAELAAANRTRIAYSGYRIDEAGRLRNSTQLIGIDGTVLGVYDKNYLTIPEHGTRGVSYGERMTVIETDIGRIAPVICFDLNFIPGLTELARLRPEIILFSSAYHGGFMQQYWAYTCRSWFVGSVWPQNPSSVVSPVGEVVASSTNYYPEVTTRINLDHAVVHIDENGRKFGDIKRKYGDGVRLHDPGQVGVVLLTAEREDLCVADVMAEFGLVDVDDYFGRSLAARDGALDRPAGARSS
ncbi:carbon-nitrogen hydrolase family protein [Occultella glacieicola]|uniref:Carbon-nitrogen hydrolase family protein n=1 Tax=Occultella glacieicola TaxID=2518684 RepID=A0ABY2E2E6_9MICO|nr:carbon-nitrogen hydrolase family protein [Occultella glacieicola]TDE92785.1 carbon-nitrogen hydrolase family protein [Occultella glacieicola]